MRAREQQFHNAWRASAVSQESAGTPTPSTREKKKELNDVVGLNAWAGIFRLTTVTYETLYEDAQALFAEPVWYRPDSPTPVPLFAP